MSISRPSILSRASRGLTLAGLAALAASAPKPVASGSILQWFESSWETVEKKMPDAFVSGYTGLWLPPPSKADSGGFSVGYDVYDRFNFGTAFDRTLYGTESGLTEMMRVARRANMAVYFDYVANHNGFRDQGTPGFNEGGGYPGFVLTLPNDVDGDFHGRFEGGDLNGRLAGLIDISQSKNYQYIRQPAFAGGNNIPLQLPNPNNRRYYPDLQLPANSQGVHPFNLSTPLEGDPYSENATGVTLRFAQYLIEVVGADGLRIDAVKHIPTFFFNDFYDRIMFQRGRPDLNGNRPTPFSFGENFDGDLGRLQAYVRKDGYGNRDTLDFPLRFAMESLFPANGFGDMRTLENASFDRVDGNGNDGSFGVTFVSSHDQDSFANANIALVHILTRTGYPVVYFNAKEFGNGRDFPKDGRGDALGGDFGNFPPRIVNAARRTAKGTHFTRWIDGDTYVYERFNSLIVGLNDRADSGFDTRTVFTGFPAGTVLEELTGAYENPVNSTGDFTDYRFVTVNGQGQITIRIPRNSTNGGFHNRGFVMYGLPTAPQSLSITPSPGLLNAETTTVANGIRRHTPLTLVTSNSMTVQVTVPPGSNSQNDNALLKINDGYDVNNNGDILIKGGEFAGFEAFEGINNPSASGSTTATYQQTVSTVGLPEGQNFLETVVFKPRPQGSPAAYSSERRVIYLDRVPPPVALEFPTQTGNGDIRSQSYGVVVNCPDGTADSMHIFFDVPENFNPDGLLTGANKMQRSDRDEFRFTWNNITPGNHSITVVAFEPTGTRNIVRFGNINAIVPGPNMALGLDGNLGGTTNFQPLPGTITDRAIPNEIVVRVDTSGGLSFPDDFTVSLVIDGTTYTGVAFDSGLLPPINRLVQNDRDFSDNFDEFRLLWRGYPRGLRSIQAVAQLTAGSLPPNSISALVNVSDATAGPPLTIASPTPGTNINNATQLSVVASTDLTARFVQAFISVNNVETLIGRINLPNATTVTLTQAVGSFLNSDNLTGLSLGNGVFPIRVIASTGLDGTGISSEAGTSVTISGLVSPPNPPQYSVNGNIGEYQGLAPLAVSAADGGTGTANPADFGSDGSLTELHGRIADGVLYLAVRGDIFNGADPANNSTIILIDTDSTSSTGARQFLSGATDISDGTSNDLVSRVRASNFTLSTPLRSQGVGFDAAVVIDRADPVSAGLLGFGTGTVTTGSLASVQFIESNIAFSRGQGSFPGAAGTSIAAPTALEVAIPLASLGNPNPRNMAFVAVSASDGGFPSPNTLPENASNAFDATQTIEGVARFPDRAGIKLVRIGNDQPDLAEISNRSGSTVSFTSWSLRWSDGNGVSALLPLNGLSLTNNTTRQVVDESPASDPNDFGLAFNIPWDPTRAASAALIDPYGLGVDYVRWEGPNSAQFNDAVPAGTLFTGWVQNFGTNNVPSVLTEFIKRDTNLTDTDRSVDWSLETVTAGGPVAEIRGPNSAVIINGDTSPSTADGTLFADTALGSSSSPSEFTIVNTGTTDLTINSVALDGTHPGDFEVTQQPDLTVGSNQSTLLAVRFNPQATGVRTAIVRLLSDSLGGDYEFTIQGTGTNPGVLVVRSADASQVISNGDSTPATGDGTDFGNVSLFPVTRSYLFTNPGGTPVQLGSTASPVTLTGTDAARFSVIAQAPQTLNPGASAVVTVQVLATAPGAINATVSVPGVGYTYAIRATVPATQPLNSVSGAGVLISPGSITPQIANGTDFGQCISGQPNSAYLERAYVITNVGSNLLTINGVTITGAQASEFTVVSNPPPAVGAGASGAFTVRFIPTANSVRNATVTVNTTDPVNPAYSFAIRGTGISQPTGFAPVITNAFPSSTGWLALGQSGPLFTGSIGSRAYDSANTALTAVVGASSRGRIIGWIEDSASDLPYSQVGTGNFVRAKYSLFYSGPGDSRDLALSNRVPNFRLSLRTRGVVTTQLEVNHNSQTGGSPAQQDTTRELGPSKNPAAPSVYRVDFDPVDVPYLTGSATEGIQRGFETVVSGADYSFVSGTLGLTDSSIGTYPALNQGVAAVKTFASGGSDFNNDTIVLARLGYSAAELFRYVAGPAAGDYFNPSILNVTVNSEAGVSVTRSSSGITVDTQGLAATRVGVTDAAFNGGVFGDTNASRLRVEPGKLYQVSIRLRHQGASGSTPYTRFNARTAGFGWNASLELLGGRGLSSGDGQSFLAQVLPGTGNQVPGTTTDGTTYRLIFGTPLSPEIRADVAGTLAQKFPTLSTQPGPGDPASSLRNVNFGFTVADSLSLVSATATDANEAANNLILNRIEVREYPQIAD